MKQFYLFLSGIFFTTQLFSANITIIQGTFGAEAIWSGVATSMGHTVSIQPVSILDNTAFFSTTDVLITPDYAINYSPLRNSNISAFMQTGKSVYLQSEYDLVFNGNQAYQTIVNSLGGSFTWTGTVAGVLAPMNVLGTLATTPLIIPPLTYFWYGCNSTICNYFDSFLEYQGQYFGFTFCPPASGTGRLMTTSDQDWILQSTSLDLMQNMLSLLLTPPSACGFISSSINLGNDTTLCTGDHLLLGSGISATSYLWSTGATTSVIIVDTTASYWLQITAGGCTAFDTINVLFNPCAINALFTPADSLICPGTCTDFIDLSLNAATYIWTFPGGNPSVSTDVNPTGICYNNPGTYDVTLIITNGNLSDTMMWSNCITVYPAPAPQGISQSGDTLFANQGASGYQWYHDGNLIAGATDYYYVADASGNFNVVCTDANGCEVEAVIFDVVAGISQLAIGSWQLALNPNPANQFLQLSVQSPTPSEITIYDMVGKKIYYSKINDNVSIIPTETFDDGVYIIQFNTGTSSLIKKFTVHHSY
jgi:hypothetical protein